MNSSCTTILSYSHLNRVFSLRSTPMVSIQHFQGQGADANRSYAYHFIIALPDWAKTACSGSVWLLYIQEPCHTLPRGLHEQRSRVHTGTGRCPGCQIRRQSSRREESPA